MLVVYVNVGIDADEGLLDSRGKDHVPRVLTVVEILEITGEELYMLENEGRVVTRQEWLEMRVWGCMKW